MWAAEKVEDNFRAFGNSFSVETKIDKKSEGLEAKLKDLNFRKTFSATEQAKWPCDEPQKGFSVEKMFQILRSSARDQEEIASSFVAVMNEIPIYYFTGTKNPQESVFKPFIFTPNARISPLTSLKGDESETLLRKLHENRKWDQVGDLLKSLEKSCVDEVEGLFEEAPPKLDELDELLKDCCEAEVKFYR